MSAELVAALTAANARLQLELEQARESNAWYRARNIELLRMLSGRDQRPAVSNQPPPLMAPDSSAAPAAIHARATLDLGAIEQPPPVTAYVRHGSANLGYS